MRSLSSSSSKLSGRKQTFCSVLIAEPEIVGGVNCWRLGFNESIRTNDAVTIIQQLEEAFDPEGVAHKPAFRPQENVIFVYDTSTRPKWKDFLSDANGSWEASRLYTIFKQSKK